MKDLLRDYGDNGNTDLDRLELKGLKVSAELLTQRINAIREERATETDPSRKFKYDTDIQNLEVERSVLMEKIIAIQSRNDTIIQLEKGDHARNEPSVTDMKIIPVETFQQGHALLIGIQYGNRSSERLPCTLSDVNGVANILTDRSKAAYPDSQVVRILEDQATAQGMLDALDDLAQRVQSDSTVVIYYTGHGGKKGSKFYFLPYDYDANLVYAETFTQKVKTIREKARKVLVILDCCHAAGSSPLKSTKLDRQAFLAGIREQLSAIDTSSNIKQLDVSSLERGEGVVVLTSCKPNETSLTGTPYSLFTQALIEVMEGRSKSTADDGWVYIEDVKRYLDTHVPARADNFRRHSQNPVTDMNGVSGHFRVCAYDIVKAKGGGGLESRDHLVNNEKPMTNNEMLLKQLIELMDTDMDGAFEELDKLSWGNKKGLFNDLKVEWVDRPSNFQKNEFRSRLRRLVNLVLK